MKRRTFCAAAVAPWGAAALGTARAQATWPSKPIRWIMPYNAGGGGDLIVRPLTAKVTAAIGQQFVIDYKPGASTMIGTSMLAHADPDGYTVGFITDSHSINPIFNKQLSYDSVADFAPVSQLASIPLAIVANPGMPFRTVPELVKYAKANPGKLAYGSLGLGGPHYMSMEWFKYLAGIDILHVPYSGNAPALQATMANEVQLMFTGISTAIQYARDGRLVAIAHGSKGRLAAMAELPSIAESGYPDYELTPWYGLAAPGKTPPDIVHRLSEEIGKALRSPDLQEKLLALGIVPMPSTPEEFKAMLVRNAAYYERMVKATGAKGAA